MKRVAILSCLALAGVMSVAVAGDDEAPRDIRHHMMEDVRDGAKAIGGMLKGEAPFDAEEVQEALRVFQVAANEFGDLFPEGTETGHDTEARETIWTDREGFNAELKDFGAAVEQAIAANPQDLASLKPAVGPVLKQCKSCHEGYRVEDD